MDAPQLAVTARLKPEDVIRIQQEEAARGPPRSLHNLARDALNEISQRPTQSAVNLDECFPWVQYVAAHKHSAEIIGPGITHAYAVFSLDTNDGNPGGAPRLELCFYRTDGSVCRVRKSISRSRSPLLGEEWPAWEGWEQPIEDGMPQKEKERIDKLRKDKWMEITTRKPRYQ